MKKIVTMRAALTSPDYFGGPDMMGGDSWAAWRVLLMTIVGEPLTDDEREVFRSLTGRQNEPQAPVREFTGAVGRRGGKSRAMGTLAAYLAGCCDYRHVLAPGQRGRLPVIAMSKEQADEVMQYCAGAFEQSVALRSLVENRTTTELSLRSRIDIQVRALSFRNLRGPTSIGVICDEEAFWRSDESTTPDVEVVRALRPSLATTKGPLIRISSTYARKGEFFHAFNRDFGPDGRENRLVALGTTEQLNPTIDLEFLADERAADPVSFGAEYECRWRGDLEEFVNADAVEAVTVSGRYELPPVSGTRYVAFVDPAGGSGADTMTLAIAHEVNNEGMRTAVLDCIREIRPPFSPDAAVEQFAAVIKSYGLHRVTGDNYAAEWSKERFRVHGIQYNKSERFRSAIYLDFLPLLNAGRVALLDHKRMRAQLVGLERQTSRTGKDQVTHPKNGHDDVINAVAGALVLVGTAWNGIVVTSGMLERFSLPPQPAAAAAGQQWSRFRGRRPEPLTIGTRRLV